MTLSRRGELCTGRCCGATCLIVSSIILFCVGLILVVGFSAFIKYEIKKTLEVYNGSASYDTWIEPTEPVYMSYFVFNVTNTEDVLKGKRPNVEQVGPFQYLEVRPRQDVTFFDNGTVKWIQPKSYILQPELSVGIDHEVKVCTINFPIMFFATLLEPIFDKINHYFPGHISLLPAILEIPKIIAALNHEETIICISAHELVWGVHDPVFYRIGRFASGLATTLEKAAHDIKAALLRNIVLDVAKDLASIAGLVPPHGIVSLQANGSDDGTWATYTGETDMNLINSLDLFQNSKFLPWWNTTTCNMVNGTDGTQYHPNIKDSDLLFTFVSELCRSIYLVYNGTVEVKGITLKRFTPPPELFDNGTNVAFLKGFCVPRCWPSGTADISVCKGGLPVMMSSPHFLYGDPVYLDNVTGMNPNFEEHATLVDLEPTTGLMLQGNKRLQLNVRVSNISFLPGGFRLRECFLPLFYANESGIVSDSDAAKLRNTLLPMAIVKYGQWSLLAVGALVFVITVVYIVRRYRKENEPIMVPEDRLENVPLIN